VRSANRERPGISALRRPGGMPFAGIQLGGPATFPLRSVILIVGLLSLLAFTALLKHKEELAVVAVACSAVLPLALRRVSVIALALIPFMVLCATPLHATKPAAIAIGLLALVTVALFSVGSLRVRSPHLWVAALVVIVLLAYLFPAASLMPGQQTQPTLIWTIGGLVMLAVCIASPPATPALLGVILVTGAISGVVASVQGDYVEGRLQGLGLNPNYLAAYLAAPIVISVGLAAHRRNLLWLAPGAACLPALLETKSRAGFLAVAAGVVFLIVQRRSPRQKLLIALIAMFAVLVMLVFPVHLSDLASLGAGNRSAVELSSDNLVRAQVAWFALHTALGHPLLGIGFGQFPAYAAVSSSFGIYITTTNEYLLLASETGLVSLAVFLMLFWPALRNTVYGDMAIVRTAIVTFAVTMLFTDSFGYPILAMPFWACLGALLGRRATRPGGPAEPVVSPIAVAGQRSSPDG
jgi:O-Antigen ligase